jgi:hypothetical protein
MISEDNLFLDKRHCPVVPQVKIRRSDRQEELYFVLQDQISQSAEAGDQRTWQCLPGSSTEFRAL